MLPSSCARKQRGVVTTISTAIVKIDTDVEPKTQQNQYVGTATSESTLDPVRIESLLPHGNLLEWSQCSSSD